MSISLANVINFFRFNKESEFNQLEGIEVLQTMQWSKLCWNESFEAVIALETLLPVIRKTYFIKLNVNESFTEEGIAYILWRPPHSELNGWWDKRPSEILDSYIIEGVLTDLRLNDKNREATFDFKVNNCSRLVSYFSKNTLLSSSFVSQNYGASLIEWEGAQNIQKYSLGNFLYVTAVNGETNLELIFSYQKDKICIHYSAILDYAANYETLISHYYLNRKEQTFLEDLISKATNMIDESNQNLKKNEIQGAQYW